jgi:hypothetical protein
MPLERRVQPYLEILRGEISNLGRPSEQVSRDYSTIYLLSKRDMRLVLTEFAPTYQYTAGADLDRCAIFISPLNKSAVAKADRTFSADFRDLMTGAPERAVTEADDPMIGS